VARLDSLVPALDALIGIGKNLQNYYESAANEIHLVKDGLIPTQGLQLSKTLLGEPGELVVRAQAAHGEFLEALKEAFPPIANRPRKPGPSLDWLKDKLPDDVLLSGLQKAANSDPPPLQILA
jgi:hypothetical protein